MAYNRGGQLHTGRKFLMVAGSLQTGGDKGWLLVAGSSQKL